MRSPLYHHFCWWNPYLIQKLSFSYFSPLFLHGSKHHFAFLMQPAAIKIMLSPCALRLQPSSCLVRWKQTDSPAAWHKVLLASKRRNPVDLKTNGDIDGHWDMNIYGYFNGYMNCYIHMEVKRNMFWGFNGISWGFTWFDHQNVGYEWGDVNGGIVKYIANLIWYFGVSKTWVIPQSGHLNFESDDNYTLWS